MKKVVRLTESDFIKIVKKVLNEQKPDVIKYAKVFDSNNKFFTNIDIYSAKVYGGTVGFKYSNAGIDGWSDGEFSCGDESVTLRQSGDKLKFSEETTEWFMSYCNKYVQNKSSINTSNYV